MSTQPAAIEVKGLRKVYTGGFEAVRGIDLRVETGDFFALLGPNGAGKSTTIGMISSILRKTAGDISIGGFDLDRQRAHAKALLGVVPQEINVAAFDTCWQTMLNQAGYYGVSAQKAKPRAEALLKKLDLWDKRHAQGFQLSGGMKRRLMIARGLVHQPKVLILDEPTAGVDVEIRQSMWAFIKQLNNEGVTIILTTHYLEEAENLCNRVAIIDQGELVEQTDMQTLLRQLKNETIVLYAAQPLTQCPVLKDFACRLTAEGDLEVDIHCGQPLHELFAVLAEQGVIVSGLRNKANRLEKLFLDRVGGAA